MKIYDFAASPNAYRVRAVAYELGLTPTFVHVNIAVGPRRASRGGAKQVHGRDVRARAELVDDPLLDQTVHAGDYSPLPSPIISSPAPTVSVLHPS